MADWLCGVTEGSYDAGKGGFTTPIASVSLETGHPWVLESGTHTVSSCLSRLDRILGSEVRNTQCDPVSESPRPHSGFWGQELTPWARVWVACNSILRFLPLFCLFCMCPSWFLSTSFSSRVCDCYHFPSGLQLRDSSVVSPALLRSTDLNPRGEGNKASLSQALFCAKVELRNSQISVPSFYPLCEDGFPPLSCPGKGITLSTRDRKSILRWVYTNMCSNPLLSNISFPTSFPSHNLSPLKAQVLLLILSILHKLIVLC